MSGKLYRIVEKRNLWALISLFVILLGVGSVIQRGLSNEPLLNYGIDFVGGSTIDLQFNDLAPDMSAATLTTDIRKTLKGFGLEKSTLQVSMANQEIIIKTLEIDNSLVNEVIQSLRQSYGSIDILEVDFIGPSIGEELRKKSLLIITTATVLLLLFLSWRFELRFGLAALVAILHDAFITLSLAALFQLEINTAFVAALLTILGYSLNDTIVLFDRIRENMNKQSMEHIPFAQIANLSIIQTLARSINTSVTTTLVILSLIFFGGTTIKVFAIILLIGVISGTYSSIFIASPFLLAFTPKQEDDAS